LRFRFLQVVAADFVVMATGMHVVPNVPVYKVRQMQMKRRGHAAVLLLSCILSFCIPTADIRQGLHMLLPSPALLCAPPRVYVSAKGGDLLNSCHHLPMFYVQGMQHFRGLQLHSSDLTDPSLLAGAISGSSSTSTSGSRNSSSIACFLWQGTVKMPADTADAASSLIYA
jgi:hypothetical protein